MSPPYQYPFIDPASQGDSFSTRLPGFDPIVLRIYLGETERSTSPTRASRHTDASQSENDATRRLQMTVGLRAQSRSKSSLVSLRILVMAWTKLVVHLPARLRTCLVGGFRALLALSASLASRSSTASTSEIEGGPRPPRPAPLAAAPDLANPATPGWCGRVEGTDGTGDVALGRGRQTPAKDEMDDGGVTGFGVAGIDEGNAAARPDEKSAPRNGVDDEDEAWRR
eukprot:2885695-Pleurochrysis_carterae.AAC.1